MNELITTTTMSIADRKFKDERLTKATQRIAAIYSDAVKYADTKNREVASILADIKVKKAYEKDGYKSVAEYASDVFGIARQNAYALATAGEVYNNPNAHAELKKMTPSKVAEVAKLDKQELDKALNEGKISAATTQKDLREFVSSQRKPKDDKPEVLDEYNVTISGPVPPTLTEAIKELHVIPEWDDIFTTALKTGGPQREVETIKLPKVAPIGSALGKATIQRKLYTCDTYSIVVEFHKPKINQIAKKEKAKALDNVHDMLMFMLENGGEDMVKSYLAEHPEVKFDYKVEAK